MFQYISERRGVGFLNAESSELRFFSFNMFSERRRGGGRGFLLNVESSELRFFLPICFVAILPRSWDCPLESTFIYLSEERQQKTKWQAPCTPKVVNKLTRFRAVSGYRSGLNAFLAPGRLRSPTEKKRSQIPRALHRS